MRSVCAWSLICFVGLGLALPNFAETPLRLESGLPPSGALARAGDDFNGAWKFSRDGKAWQVVDIPHDAAIASDFDPKKYDTGCGALPYHGHVEYRKSFFVSDEEFESLQKKRAAWRFEFDGVMSHSRILLNGVQLYARPNGYASFSVVISEQVKRGENEVHVMVDAPRYSSRWYPGLGLYRDVRLVKRGADCVVPGSVTLVSKHVSERSAEIEVAWSQAQSGLHSKRFTIENPRLWSPETPHLYRVEIGGEVFRYGIRTLRYSPTEGFFLNGKHRQMRGVCLHHDLGVFGAAFVKEAARRQLTLLKEMGCDAIRTSHNFPAPGLLDLCDEMGFMVMNEAFDEWKSPKVRHGMAEVWEEWGKREILCFVRRDRNHPCVVMWSAGNELGEDEPSRKLSVQGASIAKELTDLFHANDPERRPVTAGHWRDITITNGIGTATDVFGANYLPKRYAEFKGRQGVIGTETCSIVSTRGTFWVPVDGAGKYMVTNQVSDYGLCPMHPNDYPPDDEFAAQDANPHVYGEFVWTGFDYLGEPDPWRRFSRSSFFGIFDLCGFPKSRYWQYRSQWRPDVPTAKILPDWNRKPGEHIPVHVFTSGDEAELFLNGKSLGKRSKQGKYRIVWEDVPFEPGEIKVIAWKRGQYWATDKSVTPSAFARFAISDEKYGDFLFRTYTAVDAQGRFVFDEVRPVDFSIPDGYEIYGVCNGDPADMHSLRSKKIVSYSGKALVVFQRKKHSL